MSLQSILLCAISALAFLDLIDAIIPFPSPPNNLQATPEFQWSDLEASWDLKYEECYGKFECARLVVPLDWQDLSNSNNVTLAVIRLPATVPEDDPTHGGSVILNPGGPGGPGTLYTLEAGPMVQHLLDGPKHYEIVSFDPRGVFYSTPRTFCFDSASAAEIWWKQKRAVGNLDASEAALKFHWAAEEARGGVCADSKNGVFDDGDNVRRYLSTAYVARDMLELASKIEQRKTGLVKRQKPTQAVLSYTASNTTDAKLRYIGVSYGTYLGQTFASLYPENVGRMVLDANIDADNFVSRWEASVDDVEAIRRYFFEQCFKARSSCALWRSEDTTADDIERRYELIARKIKERPVPSVIDGQVTIITYDELSQGFFTACYQPWTMFEPFAELLNELYTESPPSRLFWQNPAPGTDAGIDEQTSHILHNGEVSAAIHCSESPDLSNTTLSDFKQYLNDLVSRFPHAGALQAEWKLPCWTYPPKLRTKWRYGGPFEGSVPILFTNNRLDPATPLKNAQKMAARFDGSSVVVNDKVGHGALFPPTDCIWDTVRTYMHESKLPQNGKVCEFDCQPFGGSCNSDEVRTPVWL